ncbi:putative MEF1-translation elongation factor G, mitochondrial [Jaminaea rosea]|uniref:Elongation factor G, mitochondrial n=1 Tax=Jaminaea rosea TaxID=1569628 RepID=A0A316V0D8_9BASI|nr:putative MEF1-translation elongation factor G, mitochondrial [Jaminaea rosea]PWN31017.1 putative MEF1-translation elongation factor G, mitochondrial [Jaminaea rosea]
MHGPRRLARVRVGAGRLARLSARGVATSRSAPVAASISPSSSSRRCIYSAPLRFAAGAPSSSRSFHSSRAAHVDVAAEAAAAAPPPVELSQADLTRLARQRNIGIAAHVDSGKTTLTERVLFYTGRIKDIHEVRGRDAVGAKMDHMELEREKGITIQSAATYAHYRATPPTETRAVSGDAALMDTKGEAPKEDFHLNIIDTPGHVDFTIEVERALRVLDGAVLVLCATSGVQSQSITVDRQMRRYRVPRISFINKMDRQGADPWRVIGQIRQKLRMPAAAVQIPIGAEDEFSGVVDIVRWKTVYNEGEKGIVVREEDGVPAELEEFAKAKRQELIEQLSEVDETMADIFLEEREPTLEELATAIRRATLTCSFSPVFMGSAIKNKGVQAMLDGVCAYLPDPSQVPVTAMDMSKEAIEKAKAAAAEAAEAAAGTASAEAVVTGTPATQPLISLAPASSAPFVGLAFKLEEGRYGQLTYVRVYQGTLKRGTTIFNARTGKKVKVPRLVRMHSNDMEDVDELGAGEICAMFGVECSSGDTFTDGQTSLSMTSMFVPDPVISLALTPEGGEGGKGAGGAISQNFSRALNRFQKEDPTFRVHVDSESGETIISGMGELHLEIYVERMKREYNVPCKTGKPRVAFRETIGARVPFNYTHKKQTGGAGQFGRVVGYIEPMERDEETGKDVAFENRVTGGNIPSGYFAACEKGFYEALEKGALTGHPIQGIRYVLEDGAAHSVDSSELAFKLAVMGSIRDVYRKAQPIVLEPKMKVEITSPAQWQGAVVGSINQRQGLVEDSETRADDFSLTAEVSLNNMFGYSSLLRGLTQGTGEFSMEYRNHSPVVPGVQKDMEAEYAKIQAKKN